MTKYQSQRKEARDKALVFFISVLHGVVSSASAEVRQADKKAKAKRDGKRPLEVGDDSKIAAFVTAEGAVGVPFKLVLEQYGLKRKALRKLLPGVNLVVVGGRLFSDKSWHEQLGRVKEIISTSLDPLDGVPDSTDLEAKYKALYPNCKSWSLADLRGVLSSAAAKIETVSSV